MLLLQLVQPKAYYAIGLGIFQVNGWINNSYLNSNHKCEWMDKQQLFEFDLDLLENLKVANITHLATKQPI